VKRLSIGFKWTLRYTAVMLLAVSLLAAYTYLRIDQRFHQDARFLVDLQLKELVETLEAVPVGDPALVAILERSTAAAGPDLKLGLQIFDANGTLLLAEGSLRGQRRRLPDLGVPDDDDRVSRDVLPGRAATPILV
jgi:hypothetical protein